MTAKPDRELAAQRWIPWNQNWGRGWHAGMHRPYTRPASLPSRWWSLRTISWTSLEWVQQDGLEQGSKQMEKTLLKWKPLGPRLLKARFNSRYTKLTVVVGYAPIEDAAEENSYEQLQAATEEVPAHDMGNCFLMPSQPFRLYQGEIQLI